MTSQTATNASSSKPGNSPRRQFRLATLFLLMVVAALAFAWWHTLESRFRRGRELQTTLTALGGMVYAEYDGPAWLKSTPVAYLFERIHSVRMNDVTDEIIERILANRPEQRPRLEPLLSYEGTPGDWLLEALAEHPHLTALQWHEVPVTDRGVRYLDAFEQLNVLQLSAAQLEDRHLEVIGRRVQLRDLNLDHNRLTDAGIASLCGLPQLVTLNLCRNPTISNAGLRQLGKLPILSELIVMGSSVTADEVAAIHRARPDLIIEWESTPDEPYEAPVVSEEIKLE